LTVLLSLEGLEIIQKNFQQIIIRGDGKEQFNQIIQKEASIFPPSKNLEITMSDKFIFAKHSFDQWSLIQLIEQNHKDILKFIANVNSNEKILASDYSYGQVYFEVLGENKNEFLNKLTHFDLRAKNFSELTVAQTLIARINCSIYNLKNRYIITCNKSFEDYFKERLKDTADI
jgi:heterotetrameric sarcosine oxidase gamma subunit